MNARDLEVEAIRKRVDVLRLIGAYTSLKRVGTQWAGCCPFHKERNPSFFVHREKKVYKCHGCGASGDLFSFVQAIEGVSFAQAKQILARDTGVALRTWTRQEQRDYAKRRTEAEPEGRALMEWRSRLMGAWRNLRNEYLAIYHDARRIISDVGIESEAGQDAANAYEVAEARYQLFDVMLDRLQAASWDDLLSIFRRHRPLGRRDA